MKLLTHATAIAAIAALGATVFIASAQSLAATQTVVRAGSQPPIDGPAANFTGRVRVEPVFPATADAPFSAGYVTFEPGARSAWHTHPAGQRLIVTAGNGRTGVWGGPALISTTGPPQTPVRPFPAVTINRCPAGCVCHAERAPGSKVT